MGKQFTETGKNVLRAHAIPPHAINLKLPQKKQSEKGVKSDFYETPRKVIWNGIKLMERHKLINFLTEYSRKMA
jgi:hypothetical protein